MTALAMSKPWIELTAANIGAVPAQLGVYELADAEGTVLAIAYAGGREPFGLRSALGGELSRQEGDANRRYFRFELTHGYLTRWEELLMVHRAQHGHLPSGNADHADKIGRLTLG